MENPMASETQQNPYYIHVRACCGKATDSHSLAKRARREKISKKMSCLQDLVPGCNNITEKAGMLDEIINYVQSLQNKVEFLSVKLSVLNPIVEFNVENLPIEEFAAYVANFPAAVKFLAMPGLAFLQLNPLQKEAVNFMLNATMNPPRTVASLSIPEQALSSPCITRQSLFLDDLREMGKKAAWTVSSCKTGNGVSSLRDDNLETYWQSDGAQPHLVNIQFQMKVKLQLDESYTSSKISIGAGDGFHNLKEIKTVELVKPTGWVYLSLSGNDPRNPIPHQPFQFTSREFITSTVSWECLLPLFLSQTLALFFSLLPVSLLVPVTGSSFSSLSLF
ncbi:hypothetical protein V6N11_040295 [Hibiscus sabdariffa]|uniref:Uncharacterized protein n=1 Tax=Hibiscus sabdariffa TaxID=183260 RepID=A0ABR2RHC6_9ROSI